MMWDNGRTRIDYEDLILQRQEEIEIWEDDDGYIFPEAIADCPYSEDGTCSSCTEGRHGGCYYG